MTATQLSTTPLLTVHPGLGGIVSALRTLVTDGRLRRDRGIYYVTETGA